MQELELMIQHVAKAIQEQFDLTEVEFHPGKVSIWLRYVRLETAGEQEVLAAQKVMDEVMTEKELLYRVAEQVVLSVFGSDLRVVSELPNLIVKLFNRKRKIHVPGAPPLEQEDQIFLKVTVYRYETGLWKLLFGGGGAG